jgi:hypothetical protein
LHKCQNSFFGGGFNHIFFTFWTSSKFFCHHSIFLGGVHN